jgi:hypothetical protein
LRWYEVADRLEREVGEKTLTDPVAEFLCRQLLNFLEARNMAVAQVGWQMADGVRALRSLLTMLAEAAAGCKLSVKKSPAWEYIGWFLDDSKYWVGVDFEAPNYLRFQTSGCQIDPTAATNLGVGSVVPEKAVPGGLAWRHVVELDSEQVHFYSRSKAGQMQWLESFLREATEMARQIEVPRKAG